MKISIKLLFISVLVFLGLGFFSTNISLAATAAQCDTFGEGFEDCGVNGVNVPGTATADSTNDSLLLSIKTFINWVLGFLATITTVIVIRGGFQMIIAAGDETKYKAGFKIFKQAGLGLLFIGISWLIISLIFWLINQFGAI